MRREPQAQLAGVFLDGIVRWLLHSEIQSYLFLVRFSNQCDLPATALRLGRNEQSKRFDWATEYKTTPSLVLI
jgi:hypothetical protein